MSQEFTRSLKPGEIVGGLLFGLLVIVALANWDSWFSESPQEEADRIARVDARTNCEELIKRASVNRETADVPSPTITKDGPQFRLVWAHSNPIKLQNGFGAMIDSTGSCVFEPGVGVTALNIDGQSLI